MIKHPNEKFRLIGIIGHSLTYIGVISIIMDILNKSSFDISICFMMFIGGMILQLLSTIVHELELINEGNPAALRKLPE